MLGASPVHRFEAVLPELLRQCGVRLPHVREGTYALLAALPHTMGAALEAFIPAILPAVLSGLADEKEAVREVNPTL